MAGASKQAIPKNTQTGKTPVVLKIPALSGWCFRAEERRGYGYGWGAQAGHTLKRPSP